MVGKVKFFDTLKGYGFIVYEDKNETKELFVHYKDVLMPGPVKLEPGQKVDFKVGTSPKNGRDTAVRVSLIN